MATHPEFALLHLEAQSRRRLHSLLGFISKPEATLNSSRPSFTSFVMGRLATVNIRRSSAKLKWVIFKALQ